MCCFEILFFFSNKDSLKIFKMVRLTPLLFAAVATASGVLNLIPTNFDKIVYQSNKPALVEFFAPCTSPMLVKGGTLLMC